MIELRNVSFSYPSDGRQQVKVLDDVSFSIQDNGFVGITGKIGSGKTTLCKLLCGLLKPSSGQILKEGRVALAMQFPESQIFESTVLKDVMFGPLNMGLPEEQARSVAEKSLESVGLDGSFFDRNPLRLSGGEKRRVALAGVLALNADIYVFDEPATGLDSRWHDSLFELLHRLNDSGKTVIIVSHSIDDIAENCRTLVYLEDGKVADFGNTADVIPRHRSLETRAMGFARRLASEGMEINYTKAVTRKDLRTLDSFVTLICVEGTGTLTDHEPEGDFSLSLRRGQSVLIPATSNGITFACEPEIHSGSSLKVLASWID